MDIISTILEYTIRVICYLIFYAFWLWIPILIIGHLLLKIVDYFLDQNRMEDTDASL